MFVAGLESLALTPVLMKFYAESEYKTIKSGVVLVDPRMEICGVKPAEAPFTSAAVPLESYWFWI